ncbi:hypothetical protein SAMN05216371_5550 [Streptomyces sp. TLI_053]|uniref:hypothetical protein n=1 Tax=Streptomyces sp. TLI_053 TaxID=1855352 RepID=UPI00087D16DB|nr:hypothetical protein [Streptomyces sp. TLI_053]SDT77826.1 hypothetical protein SAMN05216371_5550 [Streptomyces sp. TLI_053]
MDLESMPRRSGRARATALAGLALAAVAVLAGCDGGTKAASDTAASGAERAPASASASPGAATGSADPAAPAATSAPTAPTPVTTPPVDPTVTAPDPRPASPAPATKPAAPATTPTPAPTPPGGNGIAVGEPPPNGTGSGSPVHPAITYRVDGNKLTIWFYGGICQRYALKADESKPGRVDVRVTTAAPVPAGQACAELAKRQTVTADLKQPLQGRAVTDLATGQEVPLEADAKIGPDPVVPDVPGNP